MPVDTRNERIEGGAVTTVIRQQPQPDAIGRYELWLKEIIPVAQSFTGHHAVNVIRPQMPGEAYTIVLHFGSIANLRAWLDSDIRMRLVDKISPDLVALEDVDIQTGFEFWFTPQPAARHAKRFKQFMVTASAIFPLTLIVPLALRPVFARVPALAIPGISEAIIVTIIVALMVYVIMPRYTRAVSGWLYR